jgi:hypothetical protein
MDFIFDISTKAEKERKASSTRYSIWTGDPGRTGVYIKSSGIFGSTFDFRLLSSPFFFSFPSSVFYSPVSGLQDPFPSKGANSSMMTLYRGNWQRKTENKRREK